MNPAIRQQLDQVYAARRDNRLAEALRLAEDAVRASRKHASAEEIASSLLALGQVRRDLRHPASALEPYAEAVALYRAQGDARLIAHAVRHQGDLFQELDELSAAESCYQEALALYRGLDDLAPLELANALRPLAILYDKRGLAEQARRLWLEARANYQAAGVTAGEDECSARLQPPG